MNTIFHYSVARFVPDPLKGEFLNVGIVAGSDETSEWSVQTQYDSRARRFAEKSDDYLLPAVVAQLERLARQADTVSGLMDDCGPSSGEDELFLPRLKALAEQSRNVLQFTPPMPYWAESLDQAIESLCDLFIVQPPPSKAQGVTKRTLVSAVRRVIRSRPDSASHVMESSVLKASGSTAKIDFAFYNGKVAQLTQCYSFQVQDSQAVLNDAKAWAWTMKNLRERGGVVNAGAHAITVPGDVKVAVLVAPPDTKADNEAFEEAIETFRDHSVDASVDSFENARGVIDPILDGLSA